MIVRTLYEKDLDRVAAIEAETLSPWSKKSIRAELQVPDGIQCVAESSLFGVIGWCACRKILSEAELLKISVEGKSRGQGVGGALCTWLLDELLHCGVSSLFLEVRAQNHVALKFYQKGGFLQIGERINYYTDPGDNALVFKKELKK